MLPYFLKQHQNDYSNLFVPTVGFDACDSTLREHHALMITGAPGSGKTMIAQQLMVKLWDVNKCHPFRPTEPSEYSKNCNTEIPQVFHIDDVFGSTNFVKGKYVAWVSVVGNMREDLRSQNTFIIFTSRINIWNENLSDLKNYEVFSHVINVSDEKFKFTESNKSDIFENHAKLYQLDFAYKDIVGTRQATDDSDHTTEEPMGYPQRVHLLCLMKDVSTEARIRYFRHPMEFLSNIIASFREKDNISYCILILLLMNDDMLPYFLKQHQNDYSNIFVPTVGFDACDSTLREHHALMIIGAPGSGKTMIAQQLMVKLWDVNKCHPFRPTEPSEYSKNCNTEIPQVFHIDDVFGSTNFVKGKYVAWVSVVGNMRVDLRSQNTFIIFTSRINIWNENLSDLKNYEVFSHVINVSDEKFKFTESNKSDIFENHAKLYQLDFAYKYIVGTRQATDDSDHTTEEPMGYPQRVHLLCLMKDVSTEARIRYFRHPMEFLSNIIASFREKDNLSYCILILLLMNDGKLIKSFFHHSHKPSKQVQKCMDICGLPSSSNMGDLHAAAKKLCGSFLILNDDSFAAQHESIMEAATLDFGRNYPADILDRCSIQFLLERVFTKDSMPPDNDYVVIVPEAILPQLCKRLVKKIKQCVAKKWFKRLYYQIRCHEGDAASLRFISTYRVFRDQTFIHVFLRHLQQKDSLHLLFTPSSPESPDLTFLFFAAVSGQDMLVDEFISLHPSRLRHYVNRILYAACYSGSPAAVSALLVAGARANYRPAHSPHDMRDGRWGGHSTCTTTLMHAAYSGSVDVLLLVLDHLQQQQVDVTEHVAITDCCSWTVLHWLAQGGRGDADSLQILLNAGADVNATDMWGQTALYWSAECGDEVAVRAFVDAGANVNVTDDDGRTPLYCSAQRGDEAAVRTLVKAGADVHISRRGQTLLEVAVHRGYNAVADFILSSMASVDLENWSVQSMMTHMFTKDSAPTKNNYVVVLETKRFSELNAWLVKRIRRCMCAEGKTATLMSLSAFGVFRDSAFLHVFLRHLHDTESLNLLLMPSSPESPHLTFLFLAAVSGQDLLIHDVLSYHLPDLQRLLGFSDLLDHVMYAVCNSGSPSTVRALLSAGARADCRSVHYPSHVRDGWWRGPLTCTTLMHAAYSGSVDVLRLVIDHLQQQQADVTEHVHIRDAQGRTVLHWWAHGGRGSPGSLQILLNAKADVNAKDEWGQTALYTSAKCGDEAAVRALVEAGTDVNVRDDNSGTALHRASEYGRSAIVRLLVGAEADVHLRASSSWYTCKTYTNLTPLEVAVLCNRAAVAEFLRSIPSK